MGGCPPAARWTPPSDLHDLVVAELEDARARQPLDPVGDVEPQMLELQAARADDALRIVGAGVDPLRGGARMGSGERLQQRDPIEVSGARQLFLEALFAPGIDRLRDLALFSDCRGRTRPTLMEHLGVGRACADLAIVGADAKPLRAPMRPDVLAEPNTAYFAAIPNPARRDPIKPAVEMQILHEQAFHSLVPVPLSDLLLQDTCAVLMQHFIGLDIDAPGAATGVHRALRLDGEHDVLLGEVPLGVEDPHARVGDRRHQVARLVFGLADIDDDFVAYLEHRPDRGNDRKVELDGVANDGEAGQHVRSGIAGYTDGDTSRRPTADRHASRAPRSALPRAPR